jgi:hypothetical protein
VTQYRIPGNRRKPDGTVAGSQRASALTAISSGLRPTIEFNFRGGYLYPQQLLERTLRRPTVDVWIVNFHYPTRGGQWLEPELLVQRMRVSSGEQHSTKAPKIRMLDYMFHETEGNAFAAMLWQDVHVSKVCEGCLVRYGASKANLFALMKNTKTQGIVYRAFDDGAWNAWRPVRLSQKAVDRPYVEAGFVGNDFVWRHNWI